MKSTILDVWASTDPALAKDLLHDAAGETFGDNCGVIFVSTEHKTLPIAIVNFNELEALQIALTQINHGEYTCEPLTD